MFVLGSRINDSFYSWTYEIGQNWYYIYIAREKMEEKLIILSRSFRYPICTYCFKSLLRSSPRKGAGRVSRTGINWDNGVDTECESKIKFRTFIMMSWNSAWLMKILLVKRMAPSTHYFSAPNHPCFRVGFTTLLIPTAPPTSVRCFRLPCSPRRKIHKY